MRALRDYQMYWLFFKKAANKKPLRPNSNKIKQQQNPLMIFREFMGLNYLQEEKHINS